MLRRHGRWIVVFLAGLVLGGAAGYGVKQSRVTAVTVEATAPEFDQTKFAQAGVVDAGVALAQQLPHADADKCAALAKAMLAKRVKVRYSNDPFETEDMMEIREEYLPERAWEGLFKRWMIVAPQSAWAFVLEHHSEALPLRYAALRQWALIDPAAAITAAGSDLKDKEKKLLLKACINSDPAIGLKFLAQWGLEHGSDVDYEIVESFTYDSVLEKLLMGYSERSPAAAMEWCKTYAPNHQDSVCVGWMRHDSAACMEWIRSQPLKDQDFLMSAICKQADVTATSLRYFASLSESGNPYYSLESGLYSIAVRDDALAQTLIDELLVNLADRLFARSKIAYKMADKNPRKALEFMMPTLRTAFPLFENARDLDTAPELPSSVGGDPFRSNFSDNFAITHIIGPYLQLGTAAGVGKTEVLDILNQIHPQYYSCILADHFSELNNVLGPTLDWAQPYTEKMNREQIDRLLDDFSYDSADAARKHVLSLKPGPLRDGLSERYLKILLENEEPVALILDSARELGGEGQNLSGVYEYWMEKEPAAALKHLAEKPQPKVSEWQQVISSGYKTHGAQIQDMVEAMPPSALRNEAAKSLAEIAMSEDKDIVTSLYWATEITTRLDRAKQMRSVLETWQTDDNALRDVSVLEGMLSNIENSSLDEQEQALWLERIESEVTR